MTTDHKFKCEHEGCQSRDTAEYINQWAEAYEEDNSHEWLCDEHALEAGYCLGCHYFCAGLESYDFSEIKGYCSDCVQEIMDECSEYDDDDLDFGWDEYREWEDIVEGEEGSRYIGPGSENAAPEEE